MSYPEPVYHGDKGEISARFTAAGSPAEIDRASGLRVRYLATGASTNGHFGLYHWDMGPRSGGPAPHFHRTMTESFYILSGSIQLHDGERQIDTEPGDYLFVPEGGVHGFTNVSGERASMLILFSPGAPREPYFEQLPDTVDKTEEERAEFFLRHDNIFI